MTYRLNQTNVRHIVSSLEVVKDTLKYTDNATLLDKELEMFKSIQAVMEASNQEFVYITGRDIDKL